MRELHIVNAAELADAYAQAEYAVVLDGDALPIHVGEPARDMEAYWPASRYGFITAWNPASVPHSDTTNEAANAALVARFEALGAPRLPAYAFDKEGHWREEGWLVGDIGEALLDLIAREFGQAGVLAWTFGEPVRLRMQMARPGSAMPRGCIDWADAASPPLARPRPGLIA
jgi:hypothetical protein